METTAGNAKLNNVAVRDAALTLRAVNNKLRQQILNLLDENKRMNVTDIYKKLRMEQSVASQHLAILREANIVTADRDGRVIYYSLNHGRIEAIAALVNKITSDTKTGD